MTLVCKSVVFEMALLALFMGMGLKVKMTPDINLTYAGLERSCHWDSKNVSYVDVGHV